MSNNLSDSFSGLGEATKKYIRIRLELMKLSALGKATKITAQVITGLMLLVISTVMLMFVLAAFVVWYGQTYNGDYLTGLLFAIGILIVLAILALVLKPVFTTIILRKYSSMFVDETEKTEKDKL